MKFSTYAEVIDPDSPLSKANPDRFKPGAGFLLRDVLNETGGTYEVTIILPDRARGDLRRSAQLTGDTQLSSIADAAVVGISLEHLRTYDPDTTRIMYGCRIDREQGDPPLPGFDR